jgi:RNA polymerase sigma-70 factor (ECF subfamily)
MERDYALFSSLWEKYHPELLKYLYNRMGNRFDAEDVLQTTALKAAGSFCRLKDLSKAKPWFFAIATHAMNDFYRDRVQTVSIEEMPCPPADDAGEAQSYAELKLAFFSYVKKLPFLKQNLIYLYMQNTLTVKEIAKILHIGYSTARKWLAEIKDFLSAELLK